MGIKFAVDFKRPKVAFGRRSRRWIDVSAITHAVADGEVVRFYPQAIAFPHEDAAEIIWQWQTPLWKKFWTYAINRSNTEYLEEQIRNIYILLAGKENFE